MMFVSKDVGLLKMPLCKRQNASMRSALEQDFDARGHEFDSWLFH